MANVRSLKKRKQKKQKIRRKRPEQARTEEAVQHFVKRDKKRRLLKLAAIPVATILAVGAIYLWHRSHFIDIGIAAIRPGEHWELADLSTKPGSGCKATLLVKTTEDDPLLPAFVQVYALNESDIDTWVKDWVFELEQNPKERKKTLDKLNKGLKIRKPPGYSFAFRGVDNSPLETDAPYDYQISNELDRTWYNRVWLMSSNSKETLVIRLASIDPVDAETLATVHNFIHAIQF